MKIKVSDFLLRLIFPERCIVCRRFIPQGYICPQCEGEDTAVTVKLNISSGKGSRLIKVFVPHRYEGNYRQNIHRFKFDGNYHKGKAIAKLIADRVPAEAFEGADYITYVPLGKETYRQRGYNQAEVIAKELSKLTAIPTRDYITKVKQNKPQHSLSAKERKKNVKGVFALKEDIKGQKIILVDDIITTGETVRECAKLLFKGGAEEVTCICAASAN